MTPPEGVQITGNTGERYERLAAGGTLDFLPETQKICDGDWRVAPAAPGLADRRVEITGPTDRRQDDDQRPQLRGQVTMTVPFMHAYSELLVRSCHKRGAHAIGGIAAFIPSKDPEVNEAAFGKVEDDKTREAGAGSDGSWVAHPGMVEVCKAAFTKVLGDRPNQLEKLREDVHISAGQLLDVAATPGDVTEAGLRNNISVGIQYLASWLHGTGAVAIFKLMEDAATAEISRSQVWQWLHNDIVLADDFAEFLTLPAYERMP